MTYPMVGNYGVPDHGAADAVQPLLPRRTFESDSIHAAAVICQDYSADFSHWEATQSLGAWLHASGVPGVTGVDTRRLTKLLRERGSMIGRLTKIEDGAAPPAVDAASAEADALRARHLVAEVSRPEPVVYKAAHETLKVVAVDCGMKANMVREFNARGVTVTAVPWDYDFGDLLDSHDGLFVSNGPGDPTQRSTRVLALPSPSRGRHQHTNAARIIENTFSAALRVRVRARRCTATISNLKAALDREGNALRPIFGICLGNQLAGLAVGAKTTKLQFGNRGQNQPVLDALRPGACMVTSQNHGYAVDDTALPAGWETLRRGGVGISPVRPMFWTARAGRGAAAGRDADIPRGRVVRALDRGDAAGSRDVGTAGGGGARCLGEFGRPPLRRWATGRADRRT